MPNFSENDAFREAVLVGRQSPCSKSQRGVVIFHRNFGKVAGGFNAPPLPFRCNGSMACRADCNKLSVHAETAALLDLRKGGCDISKHLEMLHVKVVDGEAVPSGEPSCWQCSREVLAAGIDTFWLLHEDGLRSYTAEEFHESTLRYHELPVIR